MGAKLRRPLLAVAMLAIAGAAAGAGTAAARHSRYGVSFRTPRGWTSVNWCWTGANVTPIALLTTARPVPSCTKPVTGVAATWPPVEQLGKNGAGVALSLRAIFPGEKIRWNTRVHRRPAYVVVSRRRTDGACGGSLRADVLSAGLRDPLAQNTLFTATAVVCGPDLAAGEASFRRVLRSVRFKR